MERIIMLGMFALGIFWTISGAAMGDGDATATGAVWLVGSILYGRMGEKP